MPAKRIVYVVDDDAAIRRSIERLFRSVGFTTASYSSSSAFLEAVARLPPGCVLLDVRMPEMDGLQLQARLHRLGIALPVIVVTGHGDIQMAVQAMKEGAVDFIEKPFDEERLTAAVEAALAKGSSADRNLEAVDAVQRISRLSPRERQVLDALVKGRPNKVIGFDLGISVRTVEVHRARMMERLGVRHLAEAVRMAILADLAPDDLHRLSPEP